MDNTMTKTPAIYVPPVRTPTDHLPLLDPSTLPSNIFWNVLSTALTLRRDYESPTDCMFTAWLASMLPVTMIDGAGNIHVDTRSAPEHRSMFTTHTDTVHYGGGANKVRVDGKFWRADAGAALGADDGSGVALLAYMIEMGVPGYFVFFRGEERGGVGSKYLSKEMPSLFKDIDRAVAFDRAGYYDVITHQAGGRCCSDEFAQALADVLSTDTYWMMPCNSGVYTDTAEFIRLIPECTNVSVGYKNQHGDREEQDVEFLWDLAKACVSISWDTLPTVRDPKVREFKTYGGYGGYSYGLDDDEWGDYSDDKNKALKARTTPLFALPDEDALEHDPVGPYDEEEALMDAIEAFRTRADTSLLLDLVAAEAYPESPAMARRLLPERCIKEFDLEAAEEMLCDGWSAQAVLLEMFNECALEK
jgi:hypothetical protein